MSTPFVPADAPRPGGVLRRWAAPLAPAWARLVIEQTTRPGDLVLDPFAQSGVVGRVALDLGRSVAVADFNPVQVLALRADLTPPPPQVMARAMLRLSESVKVDRPLREAVRALYATRCPQCQADAVAEAFVWEAEPRRPIRKLLGCPSCGWRGGAPTDADDVARANELEPLSLAYWRLVDRLADPADPLRPLAERLVGLYPPRAQRAFADLLRHLENLDLADDEGEALRMAMVGALDAGSPWNTTPWDTSPPRRLDLPKRFVELNAWDALERVAGELRDTPPGPDAEWVATPDRVQTTAALPYAFVGRLATRDLAQALGGRARLALGAPPRMTPLFWTLSWAWAGWLWSRRAAAPLRPLVQRAGWDWDWYSQATGAALGSLTRALTDDGRVALAWSADRDALPAVLVGATRAGLALRSSALRTPRPGARWLDAQATWGRGELPPRLTVDDFPRVSRALADGATATALALLAEQGEPLAAETLSLAALADMAAQGTLAEAVGLFEEPTIGGEFAHAKAHDALAAAVADGRLTRLEDGRLALAGGTTALPLAERVERAALALLQSPPEDAEEDAPSVAAVAMAEVYRALPGRLAPDADLVTLALDSHGQQVRPLAWLGAVEVEPLRQAVSDLMTVGEALGYSVQFPLPWAVDEGLALRPAEVVWLAGNRPARRFVLQASALFEPLLTPSPTVPHVLVVSERVARLLRLKLRRAPDIAAWAEASGWSFLVAQRLGRWMRQPGADAEAWPEVLGLEERAPGEGQLRLFPGSG